MSKVKGLPLDKTAVRTYLLSMAKKLTSPDRPKAIGYVRVSSRKQADEGRSLEDQREAIIRHAVLSGYELVDVFADGGISGGKGEEKRPGLAAALDSIRESRAGVLIVKHVDRLSRDQDLAGYLKVELKKAGGVLEVLDEVKDDPIRKAVDSMLAELERIRGSQRMKFVYASKRQKGEWVGPVPFGFSLGSDGKLVPVEVEQPVISKILALRDQGKALRAIAAELNSEGVPSRSGKPWNPMTVSAIIHRAGSPE